MPTKKELETRIANLEFAQADFHKRLSKIEFESEADRGVEVPPYLQPTLTIEHPNMPDSLKGAVAQEIDEANTEEPLIVLFPDGRVYVRKLELVYKSAKEGITLLLWSGSHLDAPISGHIRDASLDDIVHMIDDCIELEFLKKAFPKYRFYDRNTPSELLPGPLKESETCDERPYEAPRDEDLDF